MCYESSFERLKDVLIPVVPETARLGALHVRPMVGRAKSILNIADPYHHVSKGYPKQNNLTYSLYGVEPCLYQRER
jgi:hypothetical protein